MFLERLNLFFIFKTARKGSGRLTENGWKKKWRGGGGVGVVKNTKTVQISLINDRKKNCHLCYSLKSKLVREFLPPCQQTSSIFFFFKLG